MSDVKGSGRSLPVLAYLSYMFLYQTKSGAGMDWDLFTWMVVSSREWAGRLCTGRLAG
jgi:hypothetical protein